MFNLKSNNTLGLAIATALLGATILTPANAANTYTDRTTFLAATSSTTNIDFEGIAAPGWYVSYGGTASIGGVTFTDTNHGMYVVDPAYSPAYYDWGHGAVLDGDAGASDIITATLPSNVFAIGSDIHSFVKYASDFTITLSNGDVFTTPTNDYPTDAFFGVTSDVAISSISFKAVTGYTQLDNFVYGQTSTVPEPGTVALLIGMGLSGVRFTFRRRK